MIFEEFSNLKYKYGNRQFTCLGYYAHIVVKNKKAIQKYIRNKQKEDMLADKISIKEYRTLFKDNK